MADQTIAAVRRFSRFYTRQLGILDEGLLRSSYTLAEVRVMYEIAHGDEVSAVHLTEELRIDPGYLSRIIRKLERTGIVERKTCSFDRRRSILELTDKGAAEFARLDIQQDRDVAMLLAGVSRPGQKELAGAMRLVEETLGGSRATDAPVRLRAPEHGDFGWILHRFSRLFWEEFGYDFRFEALVAGVVQAFLERGGDPLQKCWIADLSGELLGSVLVMKRSARVAQLRLLYVEPAARRNGLATRLVGEAITFAREAGYRKLMLWTQDEEEDARRLYHRLGFAIVQTRPHRNFTDREITGETWELAL